jgi:hypothetical protein
LCRRRRRTGYQAVAKGQELSRGIDLDRENWVSFRVGSTLLALPAEY